MGLHFEAGLSHVEALIESEAAKADGTTLALPYRKLADSCLWWEKEVTDESVPVGLAALLDAELAERDALYDAYATWCQLAMSDPATAQAQEPDLELPDQAETDGAVAHAAAYAARASASSILGI